MDAIAWVLMNCRFAGAYPSQQESRTYYLARLLRQKNYPNQPVETIAAYLKALSPRQLQVVLINHGIRGDEPVVDENFGLQYSIPAKQMPAVV